MYQMIIFVIFFTLVIQSIESSKIIETRNVTEKQGRDVILSCRFEQFIATNRIMWLKDGVVLSVNKEISGDRKKYEILDQFDLIIKTVLSEDSGQYICQNFEQMLSRNILLTILTQPTKPDIQQINESLIENSFGKFLCLTQGGNPLPRFDWFINQMKINESLYQIFSNNRQSYSELYLPLEKRFHNTSLICQVENQALDKPLITRHQLNIRYKPEVRLYHDQTIVSNRNLLVMENDYLIIDCRVDGNPPILKPNSWLKNKAPISGVASSSLILRNVKRADDGEYTCLSSNSVGQGQSSVHIRVQYAPIVELSGGGIVNENERLLLVCHVDSYPVIDYYQWYRNNEKLNISSLASSIVIENISKEDAGIYICMVKNTWKYSNGSSIEKFNKTQTKVIVQYAPRILTSYPLIAEDLSTTEIKFHCEIDSNPPSIVHWRFHQNILFNSSKYSILQNQSSSYLILQQIQSTFDYGFYSCNASNKLGYNSTTIQLRSKAIPESPFDLFVTYLSYSIISVEWKAGFDGGWKQSFWILLDDSLSQETNESHFTFTNLRHLEYYNITVRAFNQLGQSTKSTFIRVQTKDVPISKEDLPLIEYSLLSLADQNLHYRLDNISFLSIKTPLCLRIEIFNETNICQRIVTSSGILNLNQINLQKIRNLSICLDQYENYCGESVSIQIKRHTSFSWIFILISSILIVIFLIVSGLCIFCLILKCRRRRRTTTHVRESLVPITLNKKPSQQPVILEPIISKTTNTTNFFSNITYPEQQQAPSSYTKLTEIEKFDQFPENKISMNSSDPILSNHSSADLNPTEFSSIENDGNIFQCQYMGYSYPMKDDQVDNDYSISSKNCSHLNQKKTVYEVVV